MNTKPKNLKLLENVKVRRWYENLEARSALTASVYLRNIRLWLQYLQKDPDTVIDFALNDFEEFKGEIADQIRELERKGIAGSSIGVSVKPLISYLKFYNVSVKLNLNIRAEHRYLNAEKEIIPDKDQLSSVLRKASLRERVTISLMAFSGLRPEVMGNFQGTDGLKIGDIPELDIEKLEFAKVPTKINVRSELSKNKLPYFTFLGNEGTKYLIDYLKERTREGERLNPDSSVITPEPNMSRKSEANKFLMTKLLSKRIKDSIIRSGYNWRPYLFRVYFGTNLDSAEAKGLISHPQRQFVMGHRSDIEETYTKRNSEVKVDEIRESYSKCLKFLETETKGISENDSIRILRQATIDAVMAFADVKLSDQEKEELFLLSTDEFNQKLRELAKKSRMQNENNGNRNKIIAVKELENYLDRKWELVSIFPMGDRAVVKLPD